MFAEKENLRLLNRQQEVNMSDFIAIKNDSQTRMDKTIDSFKSDLGSLRAGRGSPITQILISE